MIFILTKFEINCISIYNISHEYCYLNNFIFHKTNDELSRIWSNSRLSHFDKLDSTQKVLGVITNTKYIDLQLFRSETNIIESEDIQLVNMFYWEITEDYFRIFVGCIRRIICWWRCSIWFYYSWYKWSVICYITWQC
jgi:hypothetical protein